MTRSAVIPFVLVLLLWGRTAFYSVDQAEYAYVTRFGEPIGIHDGANDAGLHFKAPWPIDSVQRFDRRVQSFDLPAAETLTRDPQTATPDKTLTVDATVTWRIPDSTAADQFYRTVRTLDEAKKKLGPLVNDRVAAVISALTIDDLIAVVDSQAAYAAVTGFAAVSHNTPQFWKLDEKLIEVRTERIRQWLGGNEELFGRETAAGGSFKDRVRSQYGIEIVDIRIRRLSYPEAVRSSIAERIRSERAKRAAFYESEGRKKAADITTDAERNARTIEADARAKKTVIEGQANAEAARIRAAAYAQDREFYLFLEGLRSFQGVLANTRDVLLLSTKHPLLKPLAGPPTPKDEKK